MPEELADPIGDAAIRRFPALCTAIPTASCFQGGVVLSGLLRFCFRARPSARKGQSSSPEDLARAMDYIAPIRKSGSNLTGGDPFILSPRRAGGSPGALAAMAHVEDRALGTPACDGRSGIG